MAKDAVRQVMELYPRIYFACHTRHVRDPGNSPAPERAPGQYSGSLWMNTSRSPLLDLAKHMGVTPSTMSLNIERLVRRGYVSRERAAEDGRRLEAAHYAGRVRLRGSKSVLDPARVRALC